ncbi:peptidase [Halioglobus japonicus]|uniref:Penicillin-binding protein 1A n=1 Tax=Halioglobus japonicus TaxID=930805 RepID=A0AAP8MCT8_9GAMM|nr:PBP1A family penicillin-binding protein [Halioglobus japonicus]AQA17508.1 peptidase [Halioglobus japonicus]PLW85438.1 peptidase [Halioglobus japonicus]GHD15641.1 peptidoglycan glycosyltransferase [Halioglobus japonicus]
MSFLHFLLRMTLLGAFGGLWGLAGIYLYLSPNLPDVETLRDVKLQTPMRVYTREGDLIGQFGEQKRSPLPFDDIPDQFVKALLAAEDDNFFRHQGIDLMGLGRAVSELVLTGQKGSGGSTLTMQVARNYFLSLERTFMRKFNEILLAIEIERALNKEEIFELYFNRVFLGHRAYGFEAASRVYYGKGIDELSLAQHAMLAGIPKAPSRNNPVSGPTAGKERRDWILGRMLTLGYIDQSQFDTASSEIDSATLHGAQLSFTAHYAAEMARQEMLDRYGMDAYNDGYHVYTTISSELQQTARSALINGLVTYDERHGYRGPEQRFPLPKEAEVDATEYWLNALADIPVIAWQTPAIITEVLDDKVSLLFRDGSLGELFWENGMSDARPYLTEDRRGSKPENPAELFTPGDLIRVVEGELPEPPTEEADPEAGDTDTPPAPLQPPWQLTQVPAAQAALVALAPDNGAILSIVGGMGFELSKFNRATQAQRQPGSNFKPFLYGAAMEAGFTAASIINDAPVVLEDSSLEDIWRPENDGGVFHGPTRLRWALTKSRNLVSIRLLQQLGVRELIAAVDRYGFETSDFSPDLSLALGTHAMSPLEVATGYAMLANGGYQVEPFLIDRIDDFHGETVFKAQPLTVCRDCDQPESTEASLEELSMEQILAQESAPADRAPIAPRVMEERVNFILNSILEDVITRGTGRRALVLKRGDIAGKTGTTNGPMDAWFSGYNQDVATTTWVGFDNYTPLGRREFGGTAALPIWIDYMRLALANSEDRERRLPPGIVNVKIDPETGLLAGSRNPKAIFEYFRQEHVPASSGKDGDSLSPGSQGTDDLVQDIF